MPTIPVNLADVEAFESLPEDEYLGQIDSITLQPATEQGKFDQLKVTYAVIEEGEHLGRKQSQWLSLSPKAAFRLKKWFDKFEFGDLENLEVDDETNELIEPDLVGVQVIFKVFKERDKRVADESHPDAYRMRTDVVTVEDDMSAPAAPAAKAAPEPEADEDDAESEPEEEKPARRVAAAPKAAAPVKRRTLR